MNGSEFQALIADCPALRYVDALVFDLNARARGKRYPAGDARKLFSAGMNLPVSTYYLDVTGACQDPCGRGHSDGDPDAVCRPIPGTLARIPWASVPAAQVILSMEDGAGGPNRFEPRNVAATALERLAEHGYVPQVAFELEFYLLDPDRRPGQPPSPASFGSAHGSRGTQVYGMETLDRFETFFEALVNAANQQGIPASVTTSEYAPGQFEVNLRHRGNPLRAADDCVLLKRATQALAIRHGCLASFMAKPFREQTGSGMHVHLSLLDRMGQNAFAAHDGAPNRTLAAALGGLLDLLPDAVAIFAPNRNSYRRFEPGAFVPIARSWGWNNRSVALRIPSGAPEDTRIEHRVAGADANPYLVLAAIAAGIESGLDRELDPGEPTTGAVGNIVDAALPHSISEALLRLESSPVLRTMLGAEFIDVYCAAKGAEVTSLGAPISPTEYDWYL